MSKPTTLKDILIKLDTGKYLGEGGVDAAFNELVDLLESKAETYEDGDDNGGEHLAIPLRVLKELGKE
jgi:hypothetical protein